MTHADDDRSPYPGLAAFTEEDAEFFFGREAEVAQLWRKLTSRKLLAVIGPSGVGKSSFLRAGLIPAAPDGWGVVICKPGEAPFAALARTLAPEFRDDPEAIAKLVDIGDASEAVAIVSRWRGRHDQALLIVDQFEELFTLNPAGTQSKFAELAGRLARDGDVHVLLSMRDDFLHRCHEHDPLRPLFDLLTPISTPTREGIRRALIEPAARHGYAFEEEGIVEEMLEAVEGERGALPMLAFAVARLWEERDPEKKQLTRNAYENIGGVDGALAQHAESTLATVGSNRLPIVREIFRNLITAEGTRAVREWSELLSVFDTSDVGRAGMKRAPTKDVATAGESSVGTGFPPAPESAENVLKKLIDARLLTSFEEEPVDGEPHRKVEVVHESLLTSWPRMVRWQTQDADAALLRDQLRQAARTWDEQGRTDDTLWTASAYREFLVWRERYPGGLTEIEEAFSTAMTVLANRRRRRGLSMAGAAALLLVVLVLVFATLWQRTALAARRAEAQKLVALGQALLEDYGTAALAYATASLEISDTEEARLLAVEALWTGPPVSAMPVPQAGVMNMAFSPDGRHFAASSAATNQVFVWSDNDDEIRVLGGGESPKHSARLVFDAEGAMLIGTSSKAMRIWAVPDFELIRTIDREDGWHPDETMTSTVPRSRVVTYRPEGRRTLLRSWSLSGGVPSPLGQWDADRYPLSAIDPTRTFIVFASENELRRRPIEALEKSDGDRVIGRHRGEIEWFWEFWGTPEGGKIVARDSTGETRVWSLDPRTQGPNRVLRGPGGSFWIDSSGSRLFYGSSIWELAGPPNAEALQLVPPPGSTIGRKVSHPNGRWIVASGFEYVFSWPVRGPYPYVLRGHRGSVTALTFSGDGTRLVSASTGDHTVRLWPLNSESGELERVLWTRPAPSAFSAIAVDPTARYVLVSTFYFDGRALLVPLADEPQEPVDLWPSTESRAFPVAFSLDGRFAAAGALGGQVDQETVIRVWDLESGDQRVLELRDDTGVGRMGTFYDLGVGSIRFTPNGELFSAGHGGVRRWNLDTGQGEWLSGAFEAKYVLMDASGDGGTLLTLDRPPKVGATFGSNLTVHDLGGGTSRRITSHGDRLTHVALDSAGKAIATVSTDGIIRIGPVDGRPPHIMMGHDGKVNSLAIGPNGRWIASGGEDGTIRLWPTPDLSSPPLHTLPHDELIAKLHILTNLRAVRDEGTPTGWKIEVGPFPGWAEAPTW